MTDERSISVCMKKIHEVQSKLGKDAEEGMSESLIRRLQGTFHLMFSDRGDGDGNTEERDRRDERSGGLLAFQRKHVNPGDDEE